MKIKHIVLRNIFIFYLLLFQTLSACQLPDNEQGKIVSSLFALSEGNIPVAACLAPKEGWQSMPPNPFTGVLIEHTGIVTKLGIGTPPKACLTNSLGTWAFDTQAPSNAFWFHLKIESGESWVVSLMSAEHKPSIEKGDRLKISFKLLNMGHGGSIESKFTIFRDKELLVLIGNQNSPEALTSGTQLKIAKGHVTHRYKEPPCGKWEVYEMNISVNEKTTSLKEGTYVDLDAFRFFHGGYRLATLREPPSKTGCYHFGVEGGFLVGAIKVR